MSEATEYTIRAADAGDADIIKRMVRSAPLNPNAIDWHYFVVLEIVEEGVKQIASIGMVYPEGDVYEIDSVTTKPEYRKRGYAAAVVRALIERSPKPLFLLAETDLIAFYERLGFATFKPEDAPQVMREQKEWLDRMFGEHVTYHVMGIVGDSHA